MTRAHSARHDIEGPPVIPISTVQFSQEEEELVLQVLRSGSIAQGPMVARLEEEFARRSGVRHAVAVNNGTTALVAALQVMDLEPGDEVITSPFTFVATVNAILEAGASVTFADIREDDFAMDASSLTAGITDRTRVVAPVHLYGQMADMSAISAIAESRGLRILEDASQSHFARFADRAAGSYDVGTFSFYATKNITTGEGGIITTDDDDVAARLRILRNQGMRARYEYVVAGHNYRLTDLQAALALPQLDRYDETVNARSRNAALLTSGLRDLPGLITPTALEGRRHVWHQYTVRVTPDARLSRDDLVAGLAEAGVGSGVYYPKLIGDYPVYDDHPRVAAADTPVARRIASEVVSLPVHHRLTSSEVDRVIDAVAQLLGGS